MQLEAAVALQMLVSGQGERAEKNVEPHIRQITLKMLNIIRETENDELLNGMQRMVSTYKAQLIPMAVEICQHLKSTLAQAKESNQRKSWNGILKAIRELIVVMKGHQKVLTRLEPLALQVGQPNFLLYNKMFNFPEFFC